MLLPTSPFLSSAIILPNNAVKAIIFRFAEFLLALAVFKIFSLIAATANLFTPYLMFAEDYIQRLLYLISRRLSSSSILVLGFTLFYVLAELFGTLLWALDSPGYVIQPRAASALDVKSALLSDPAYIVTLTSNGSNLAPLDDGLARSIGVSLFNATLNFTLTGKVDRGERRVVQPTRPWVGGRIWLDDDGFSVSPDTAAMVLLKAGGNASETGASGCPPDYIYTGSNWAWNCTFDNDYVPTVLDSVVGRPEVHWDDISDSAKNYDSRYIKPRRLDNIWANLGKGGGTLAMKQMFTVTKGTNRHVFMETTFRSSMVEHPWAPFSSSDIEDMLKRTYPNVETEPRDALLGNLLSSITKAQSQKMSFTAGINEASKFTTTQTLWEYLIPMSPKTSDSPGGEPIFSLFRVVTTNITLVRSDNVDAAPTPIETCEFSYQNQAYGGKVKDTDCIEGEPKDYDMHFFGQVDTSAVLLQYGLGDGRSNISSKALDQSAWEWFQRNSDRVDGLLLARGFIVSISPSLVTIELGILQVAVSGLQLLLVGLAVVLFGVSWLALNVLGGGHWSNSFLSNVVSTTYRTKGNSQLREPGYMHKPPEIQLRMLDGEAAITVGGAALRLDHDGPHWVESAEFVDYNALRAKSEAGVWTGPQEDQETGVRRFVGQASLGPTARLLG